MVLAGHRRGCVRHGTSIANELSSTYQKDA
jgi:hypothetical protein